MSLQEDKQIQIIVDGVEEWLSRVLVLLVHRFLGQLHCPSRGFSAGHTVKRHCSVSSCVPAQMLPVYLLLLMWPKCIHRG